MNSTEKVRAFLENHASDLAGGNDAAAAFMLPILERGLLAQPAEALDLNLHRFAAIALVLRSDDASPVTIDPNPLAQLEHDSASQG